MHAAEARLLFCKFGGRQSSPVVSEVRRARSRKDGKTKKAAARRRPLLSPARKVRSLRSMSSFSRLCPRADSAAANCGRSYDFEKRNDGSMVKKVPSSLYWHTAD